MPLAGGTFTGSVTIGGSGSEDRSLIFGLDGRASAFTGQNAAHIFCGQGGSGDFLAGSLYLQSRSGTAGREIAFITGTTPTKKLVIEAGGDIGIGIDNPAAKLNISSASDALLTIQNNIYQGSGQNTEAILRFKSGAGTDDERAKGGLLFKNDGSAFGRGDLHFIVDSNDDNGNAVLADSKMVISHEGKIGIATDSPLAMLEIDPPTVDTAIFAIRRQDSATIPLFQIVQDSSVSQGTGHTHVNSGNRDMSITAGAYDTLDKTKGIYIKTTGEVGFGLSGNPTYPIDVASNSSAQAIKVRGRSDNIGEINFTNNAGDSTYSQIQSHATTLKIKTLQNIPLSLHTNNVEKFNIANAGAFAFMFDAGASGRAKLRTYSHYGTLASGGTVNLFRNTGIYDDLQYIMTVTAFHSGRTYRIAWGTIGGYGHNQTTEGTGSNFSSRTVETGKQGLTWSQSSGYTATYYISGLIFGGAGVGVDNGTVGSI
jgi:hypothetical protein